MKDLISGINATTLVKTEIQKAYAKDVRAKAITSDVDAVDGKQTQLRSTIRKQLAMLSKDGKSQTGLYSIELTMNNYKVQGKKPKMDTLKSTIEWAYTSLVNDKTATYFVKENRKSMKNVCITDETPCVMSTVLPRRGGNVSKAKEGEINTVLSLVNKEDVVLNLTVGKDEKFSTKNSNLFTKFCEIDTEQALVIEDSELNHYFEVVVNNLKKELQKARLQATKPVKKTSEVAINF